MTQYFENVKTLDELKKQYRRLAIKYHPDMGGSTEIMQQINAEFDRLFPIYKLRSNDNGEPVIVVFVVLGNRLNAGSTFLETRFL